MAAYRIIPVHPDPGTYVPKIFTAIADALAWHLHQAGIPDVDHYLDHYLDDPLQTECLTKQRALSALSDFPWDRD